MAYKVIARRWRPQTLDKVVGQRHVTQTLRNAFQSGRIAQAFVFAGPRGVGKTTTARILARMLNCEHGPTPDPCGACDPCKEIAEDRDMDVLEIDAATHTGIDNVREVIIAGLGMLPVRDRYKIFIIDEVHQLSGPSFNALLKSIEEPPAHVAFIMATTLVEKIPETILSRSQLFEFKTIASRVIAEQLRMIADADGLTVSNEALALVARAAEGSMRDAETAFDQVIAFAGTSVTVEDVATVLGLVGRDLLFDVMTAVADEDGPAAFELAGRAVEAGYDLKMLCRELSRLVRDLLVLSVDPSRVTDPDIAPETDRERLTALQARFSREDLLRAFDLLMKAEADIRYAAEPRYHLEMALLRWIHLRKLTPLAALIEQLGGAPPAAPPAAPSGGTGFRPRPLGQSAAPSSPASSPAPSRSAPPSSAAVAKRVGAAQAARQAAPPAAPDPPAPAAPVQAGPASGPPGDLLAAFKNAVQKERPAIYGTVVAQARNLELRDGRLVVTVSGAFQTSQVAQSRAFLESVLERLAGKRVPVACETIDAPAANGAAGSGTRGNPGRGPSNDELTATAKSHPAVQALLGIIPAEIKDVTELK